MEKKIISAIFAYRLVRLKMEELNVTIFKVWMKGKEKKKGRAAVVTLTAVKISHLPSIKT